MKRLLMLLVVFFLFSGFTLSWNPVDRYMTGELIGGPVMYDAWQDNAVLAVGTSATSIPTTDNTFGASHVYKLRTRLSDGRVSADTVATLSNPLDSRLPQAPAAAGMVVR